METKVLKVSGMDCGGCETSISKALGRLEGVESSTASHSAGTVEVTYDPSRIDDEDLAGAIADAGNEVVE